MEKGIVKWFDKTKGFGFIAREGAEDLFVHYKAITDEKKRLRRGDVVEFEIEQGPKGVQAGNVKVLESRPQRIHETAEGTQPLDETGAPPGFGDVPPAETP